MQSDLEYVVSPGDCLASIAEERGFYWKTLWDANPALKSLRGNPNVLLPGDVVRIPAPRDRNETCATSRKHTFIRKGSPAKFRLVLEQHNIPLADRPYILEVDGRIYEGRTDSTGLLEVSISPTARAGRVRLPEDGLECPLQFGHLDPATEVTGVQQRLQNLGFLEIEPTGEMDDETRTALAFFQSSVNLPPSGELDDATRQRLLEMQDQQHQQQSSGADAPPDAPEDDAEGAEAEPVIDPEEDEAEMERFTSLDA